MFNSTAQKCNVTFTGATHDSITGTGTKTEFGFLTVNKGNSQEYILNVNASDFSFSEVLPLTILNGTFRLTSAQTVTLSQAADFFVPSTGCLSANGGTIRIAYANEEFDFNLSGKLEIWKGAVYVGNMANNQNNDIIYSAGGLPEIDIKGGNLYVNGQIKRGIASSEGSLVYSQTAGNVYIYGRNHDVTRGKFEILNNGEFNMSGGGIYIHQGGGNNVYGDVYIRPNSSVVTGGTFYFIPRTGGANQNYRLDATVPLGSVIVQQNGALTSTVQLLANPLVLNDSLYINSLNATFTSNNYNVSLYGNFLNSGTYNAGTNSTIFLGDTAQKATFNRPTTFYELNVNKTADILLLAGTQNPTVSNNLALLNGTLNDGGLVVNILGDIYNSAVHTSTGGGYLNLNGTTSQIITGNDNGVFDNVTINNAAGIKMQNNSTINGTMTFTNGLFYIDDNLLTLGEEMTVAGTTNGTKMIALNGSPSDLGVKKLFPATTPYNFTFPIGVTGNYTPATYNITANTAVGTITVTPVNYVHPATTGSDIDRLTYYWTVSSTGFATPTLTHNYTYVTADALGDEGLYVTGRFYNSAWTPVGGIAGTVTPASNLISLNAVNYIDGDYTAGNTSRFQAVLIYYSRNATLGGDWNDVNSWSTVSHAGPPCAIMPNGNPVIIAAGHTIKTNGDLRNSYSMLNNGTVNLLNSTGHNFGIVSGAGKFYLTPTAASQFVFPGGNFTSFMNTTNALVEFNGAGLLPTNKVYQDVLFSGAGNKNLANVDYTVKGNLTIAAGVLNNTTYNRTISVAKDWEDNVANGFSAGTGTVIFNGSALQTINNTATTFERFHDIKIQSTSEVTFQQNLRIDGNFQIDSGIVNNTYFNKNIELKENWTDYETNGFLCGTGTVTFLGTAAQYITTVSNETFFNFVINNNSNVFTRSDISIEKELNFTNGSLNINQNFLTLSEICNITNSNSSKYIICGGASSLKGVVKEFAATATATPYVFPIGVVGKYTPAEINLTSNTSTGTIRVNPVNDSHPYMNDMLNNELHYYWQIDTTGFAAPKTVVLKFSYIESDITPIESQYYGGRFYEGNWTPPIGIQGAVNGTTNIITFTGDYLTGEYTCGERTNFRAVVVPPAFYYSRDAVATKEWTNPAMWSTLNHSDNTAIAIVPPGLNTTVIIADAHRVTIGANFQTSYALTLNGTARLELGTTTGHILGNITGTGTLALTRNGGSFVLPTGVYTNFVAVNTGTMEFDGTGSLPLFPTFNNIVFVNAGTKSLANNDLLVNGNFIIRGGVVDNSAFNKNMEILGNWIDSVANGFTAGAATISFKGTTPQTIAYIQDATGHETFNNLVINNAAGVTLLNHLQCNGTMNVTNGNFNVTEKKDLSVVGNSTIDGVLRLNTNLVGQSSFIDNGTILGNGTVYSELFLKGCECLYNYHYFSASVDNAPFSMYKNNIYYYFEPHGSYFMNYGWRLKNAGTLAVGNGYNGSFPNDTIVEYVANPPSHLNTSTKNITLSFTPTTATSFYEGWNFVGNPYPSAIDWENATLGKVNIDNTIYFWNGASYSYYLGTGGTPPPFPDNWNTINDGTQFIPAMQGFFVKANAPNPSLTFTNNARLHHHGDFNGGFWKKETDEKNEPDFFMKLQVDGYARKDQIVVHFYENATNEFDSEFDAYKFIVEDDISLNIYTMATDSNYLAINSLPPVTKPCSVPLFFEANVGGNYTFTLVAKYFGDSLNVFLEDKKLNKTVHLNKQNTYTFHHKAYENYDRFVLHFNPKPDEPPIVPTEENISIYSFENKIYVDFLTVSEIGFVGVYNLLGQNVFEAQVFPQTLNTFYPQLTAGEYIVKVLTPQNIYTQKIFLR